MEELACKVGRSLTPEAACVTVQAVRPIVVGRICDALADQLLEGVPPEYLQPDPDPADEPEPPSPNGEIGEAADGREPIAGNEPPSPNGDNGGPAPSDDSSKRSGVTGRARSAGPRPRPLLPAEKLRKEGGG